ncbi:MAG: MtrB/PioB family decaheme-associated outer membrane protein, partial [Deltaproteobacteria bacterium]|nr:MtrB/PioB family decaheme-associated outer membrane protein [Deltaproteobacteria bacterium]
FVMPSAKSVHVTGNKAKFGEYGDPDSSISGGVEVKSEGDTGYMNFSADEIGQDTQNYKAEAGQYGKFKLDAFYNEIQHNNTFDAKTFYSGAGTNHLTSPLSNVRASGAGTTPPPNPATWNLFDYEVSRNQYGAGIRLDMLKPFFANLSVSQEDRKGIRPIGTGNSNLAAELPEPVDFKTDILQTEVGYGKDPYFVSLGYTHSNFKNAYDALYFNNIYAVAGANTNEFVTLPPDNSYDKFDLKGRVKMPLKSTLALGYSKAKAESDANLFSSYNYSGTANAVTLSDSVFNGRVDTTNYSAVLTSNPLDFLDGKFFYKNYATKNKSDEITSTIGTTTITNALFDYTKKTYGVEAGLKLPGHVTLTPSYSNVETVLPDNVTTDDNIFGINAKWKGNDFLAGNIGYERMNRNDHVDSENTGGAAIYDPYTRMFDTAAQRRNIYKLGLDVFPTDMLNLGFTLKHKNINYNETAIGLTGQRGNTYGASATFTPNDTVSVNAYVDYEINKLEQLHRYGATTVANASPVDTTTTDAIYNVTTTEKDKSLDWGVGLDVKAIPKILALRAQFDHTRSNGLVDFTYANNSTANNAIQSGWDNNSIDYANWDDYKKDSLLLKGIYSVSSNLDLTGGYAYEKYTYNDGQYDNYANVYYTSATTPAYLSGANANPDYTANVVFLTAKYKF